MGHGPPYFSAHLVDASVTIEPLAEFSYHWESKEGECEATLQCLVIGKPIVSRQNTKSALLTDISDALRN